MCDTYKVATVRNSCSTMHKLVSRDLTAEDFEGNEVGWGTLQLLNEHRWTYWNDKRTASEKQAALHLLKMHLPEGYLQMATYSFSFETGLNMYLARHNHRMPEWSGPDGICAWLLKLPYMKQFVEAAQKDGHHD